MPFLLLWQSWGPAVVNVDDVCLVGHIAVQSYPSGSVDPINPIGGLTLAMLIPHATAIPQPYPKALIGIGTYPISTIVRVNEPTTTGVMQGGLEVEIYPMATIEVKSSDPTSTIDCKPSL